MFGGTNWTCRFRGWFDFDGGGLTIMKLCNGKLSRGRLFPMIMLPHLLSFLEPSRQSAVVPGVVWHEIPGNRPVRPQTLDRPG